MSTENQLQTLIDAAVRKAVEDTAAQFGKLLQSAQQNDDALAAKNRELLSEKKTLEGKPKPQRSLRETLADFDAETDRIAAETAKQSPAPAARSAQTKPPARDIKGNLVIDRADPRAGDPSYYRAMREEAAKRGVPLRYVDSRIEADTGTRAKFETLDDTTRGIRWMRRDVADKMGIIRADRLARRDGLKVRTFESLEELPPEAREMINEA